MVDWVLLEGDEDDTTELKLGDVVGWDKDEDETTELELNETVDRDEDEDDDGTTELEEEEITGLGEDETMELLAERLELEDVVDGSAAEG